ncbi:hypothetical protein [Tsuneonella suprasediminis]|nr:hypothetical protein [Tsuneonella suprasediminis]
MLDHQVSHRGILDRADILARERPDIVGQRRRADLGDVSPKRIAAIE